MKKLPDHLKDGIGTALDDCSWDFSAPTPQRRFFLNPMSAFFGDFPWEGRKSKGAQTTPPQGFTQPESPSDPDIPE
ncbi:MAG: hypothetical protein DRJ61_18425 [Acidobacteria bacterium]|nr:MAG: hypothetical protein DRJ61_18425 [Acidobacteriota bacterium]RLE26891.1 MAG: hypothetical protein DRJ65_04510 [Acidobacteriota bacterium]